jgi:hypothetical protein
MTCIIIIDPVDELIIHNIPIETKESARRCDNFQKALEAQRGHELERIIVSMHTVRIMERTDPVPVPLFSTRLERT